MRAIIHSHPCRLVVFLLLGTVTTVFAQVRVLHSLEWPYYVTPVQGRDGRIYAPQSEQNYGSCGDIFRISTGGTYAVLDYFSCADGSTPYGGLTLGTDGYFYGTTLYDGSYYDGVLYRISTRGVITDLHSFAGGTDGMRPYAPPIEGTDGNFYGTTLGDSTTASTVYSYNPSSGAITTLLQLQPEDGSSVYSPLIQALDGTLYGIAYAGGANGVGTAFQLTTAGVLLNVYSFPLDQQNPYAPLIQANDGNFYGTTHFGSSGMGSIFKMDRTGAFTTLHSLDGVGFDGEHPVGGLVQATDGMLYGTTQGGGMYGNGTIFRTTTAGKYRNLYSFPQTTGQTPQGALLQHTNGTFYGTTAYGGPNFNGAIFSFNVGLSPFVSFVLASSRVGHTAEILGQGLTGTTSVTFNGIPATFTVKSDSYITATVPTGATTGTVSVTTPTGTLNSNISFRVIQ